MTTTGLKTFDETVKLTNIWLKELQERLGLQTRHQAYHVLRVVLHQLRDHLPTDAAIHLSAQMPMLVRGFYIENWRPTAPRTRIRKREEFIDELAAALEGTPDVTAQQAVEAVYALLSDHISAGEIADVVRCLPDDLKPLWDRPHAA